jgi:Flp pilus assembly protein TadB
MDVVNPVLAVVAGAVVGLGLFVAVMAVVGQPSPEASRRPRVLPPWLSDRMALRASLAAVALVLVWAVTGWPAGGLMAAVIAAAAPSLVGAKARRQAAVARIEAIAGWAEQLRDVMAAADGIQSAILTTAPLAPEPIRPEVRRLADRLARHERLSIALRRFADEVAHPLTDMIVTSLLIASERQGRLADLLGEVAASARATATMRLRVEAARARTYVTTRLIIGVTVTIATWLVLVRREYLRPFDTVGGQAMLTLIGAVFAVSGVLMQRMARPDEPARLLAGVDDDEAWR